MYILEFITFKTKLYCDYWGQTYLNTDFLGCKESCKESMKSHSHLSQFENYSQVCITYSIEFDRDEEIYIYMYCASVIGMHN